MILLYIEYHSIPKGDATHLGIDPAGRLPLCQEASAAVPRAHLGVARNRYLHSSGGFSKR